MKPNIQAVLDRCISEGIEHAFLNTNVEVTNVAAGQLTDEIENRIWLYIDEYFEFDN